MMLRVLKNSLILLLLIVSFASCTSVRIPTNSNKAKNVIEKKAREISAIADFHDLKSPLVKTDTITIRVPERTGSFLTPSKFNERIDSLFNRHIFPVFIQTKDTLEIEQIRQEFKEVPAVVDTVYEDPHIIIEVKSDGDKVAISYTIKSEVVKQPVDTETISVDTTKRWYDNNLIVFSIFLVGVSILFIVVYNLTKKRSG